MGTYRLPSQKHDYYFENISNALNLTNLVNENTCFKSIANPSRIDIFITNSTKSFLHTSAITTGISDFHQMIITVLRLRYKKAKPREIIYRSYQHFNHNNFERDLMLSMNSLDRSYGSFEESVINTLNKHAPLKKKIVRANELPDMTKNLRKAIATRSRLENRYYKSIENKLAYKKQRNFCSRLYKKERKVYYTKLNINNITDNRKFWKTMKPFFSDKGVNTGKITLIEDNQIISANDRVAETLNSFFDETVKLKKLELTSDFIGNPNDNVDAIDVIIRKYACHPSILKIS